MTDMDSNEVYLNILKENLLFMRHQETQRMWIANVFVAIVVGFLALIGKEGLQSLPWYLYLAPTVISLLCLLITLKLNYVFNETQKATKYLTKYLLNSKKIGYLGEDWQDYIVPLDSKGVWDNKFLRVRCLYIMLYLLAAAGFLALCILQPLLDC